MNPALISAFAALAGAIIGGLTSFATSWYTQRAQLRSTDRQARRAKLEALYNEYLAQVASLYVDALTHNTEDPSKMVPLYILAARMRLASAGAVIEAARPIDDIILETYMGPNRTLEDLRADLVRDGGIKTLLARFSDACRADLDSLAH